MRHLIITDKDIFLTLFECLQIDTHNSADCLQNVQRHLLHEQVRCSGGRRHSAEYQRAREVIYEHNWLEFARD